MVTKPWSERTKTTQQLLMESMAPLSKIAGVRVIPQAPPPLPGGGNFPVDLVIASAAEPKQLSELADQLVQKAFASGLFIFADSDLKFDQPQAEVVFDRDKLRSQGVDLSQAGRDLSTLLGANYVNRFSIQGRSYKVIPQVMRAERLTPDQLEQIYITGLGRPARPAVDLRQLEDDDGTARPEEVPAAERGPHSGRHSATGARSIRRSAFWKPRHARSCRRASTSTTRENRVSSEPRAAGSSATFLLSAVLIYLVLAAQFESFRDPFIILAGSVPLAVSGALLFSFLGFTTLNIYSQVGLITLVGLVSKNGILIVQFANHLQETGQGEARRDHRSGRHASAADPDDDRGNRRRPFPARHRHRPRRRSAQQHRHHAGEWNDHRHALHAVRRSVHLHAGRTRAHERATVEAQSESEAEDSASLRRRYEYEVSHERAMCRRLSVVFAGRDAR